MAQKKPPPMLNPRIDEYPTWGMRKPVERWSCWIGYMK